MEAKTIYVYENWSGIEPIKIGTLYVDYSRSGETFSFEYDKQWISEKNGSFCLDPDLYLYGGRQYIQSNKANFGVFTDSAPDRWGRTLMNRREIQQAKSEDRKPKKLLDSDYLLGVYDESRMGAIRFSTKEDGPFLSNDIEMAAPPWTSLRTLEEASRNFEEDETSLTDKWLKQLLGPGSSLGGARPKANIKDVDGNLWIAKFPSRHDEYDIGAWEKVTHDLAKLCGLNVPESKLEKYSNLGDTFLVKRFDRNGDKRIHFSSAMTMLGKIDGASAKDGTSYLDIVAFIRSNGTQPNEDLKELWKRIVFNMAVSNTDDHLRNHGFILESNGWELSPLFDVNPNPMGDNLSLNVSMEDSSIDFDLAIETARFYGINNNNAMGMIKEIASIVHSNWDSLAKQYGISRSSVEFMRSAFRAADKCDL